MPLSGKVLNKELNCPHVNIFMLTDTLGFAALRSWKMDSKSSGSKYYLAMHVMPCKNSDVGWYYLKHWQVQQKRKENMSNVLPYNLLNKKIE